MKRNVLLLCLSVVNTRSGGRINQYAYHFGKKDQIDVEGLMTNEAPAKCVIEKLYREEGEGLDDIVVICSDTTRKAICSSDGPQWLQMPVGTGGRPIGAMTHLEYYQTVINDYARAKYPDLYGQKPIRYSVIEIPDDPDENRVTSAAVAAADYVLGDDENVDLYIDYNGGPRYVAFMILNIANLMRIRNIQIQEVLTMNFDNKIRVADGREIVPVQNMAPVFNSGELVAGINEYVNYGRIRTLRNYFRNHETKAIKDILDAMESFSNNLQLCRTGTVFKEKGELKQKLDAYMTQTLPGNFCSPYETLFAYVVGDILDGYGTLLTGELPEVIAWCVQKDFVQQALTFYVERMPVYFWESGIFRPTAQEEKEFTGLWEVCEKDRKRRAKDADIRLYNRHYRPYGVKYSWLTAYLKNGRDFAYTEAGWHLRDTESIPVAIDKETVEKMKAIFRKYSVKWKANAEKSDLMAYPGYIGAGRAVSNRGMTELQEIFLCYELLKQQRNKTNHADDNVHVVWCYEMLCEVLLMAVDSLRRPA